MLDVGHEFKGRSASARVVDFNPIPGLDPSPRTVASYFCSVVTCHPLCLVHQTHSTCHAGGVTSTTTAGEKTTSTDATTALAGVLSFFADYGFIFILGAAFDVLRGRRTAVQAALRLAALGFPILIVTTVAKQIVGRTRPEGAEGGPDFVRTPRSPSFPSGHTLAAATAAVALPATLGGAVLSALHLVGVGWSRIRLGAHHNSDVAGGMAIGLFLGLILRPVLKWIDTCSF